MKSYGNTYKKQFIQSRGFTLGELLIVVAIIAVLVAVSIPVFQSQLEKSRKAVDLANERAAYGLARTEWIAAGNAEAVTYYYVDGALTETKPSGAYGYGRSSEDASTFSGDIGATVSGVPKDNVLKISIAADATMTMTWGDTLATWKSLSGVTTVATSNWWSDYTAKTTAYNNVTSVSNTEREKADKEILNAMADYFNGMSVSDAQAILGSQYTNIANNNDGGRILEYTIDGGKSVRITVDGATTNASYLSGIGYSPSIYTSNAVASDYNVGNGKYNYVNQYLFTSDGMVGSGSKNIKMTFDEVDGKIANTTVWVQGLSGYTSE